MVCIKRRHTSIRSEAEEVAHLICSLIFYTYCKTFVYIFFNRPTGMKIQRSPCFHDYQGLHRLVENNIVSDDFRLCLYGIVERFSCLDTSDTKKTNEGNKSGAPSNRLPSKKS
jgi:hypothetical protein